MLKRIFDLFFAIILIIIFLPILILFSILIWKQDWSNPFYVAQRVGRKNRLFKMIKFRSMVVNADKSGVDSTSSNDTRITPLGALIRKYKIDELPNFINILFGQMSFVGPRPLLVEYLPLYSDKQFRRHKVKPGITGWAQVNGRNSLSWAQKFNLDCFYVKNISFFLDLKIIFLTIFKVISKDGINSKNHVTVKPFTGNNP